MTDRVAASLSLACHFSDDRTSVQLTIPAEPPVTLVLNCDGVESLIGGLSQIRAQMRPEVPRDWPKGSPARGQRDPRIECEQDVLNGGLLLRMRHPGLGWLHFSFPPNVARKLGTYLLDKAKRARVSPSKVTRN